MKGNVFYEAIVLSLALLFVLLMAVAFEKDREHHLELYAKDCYSATEQHIANVNKLDNLSKIHNYRYNNGYPEKLKFNI